MTQVPSEEVILPPLERCRQSLVTTCQEARPHTRERHLKSREPLISLPTPMCLVLRIWPAVFVMASSPILGCSPPHCFLFTVPDSRGSQDKGSNSTPNLFHESHKRKQQQEMSGLAVMPGLLPPNQALIICPALSSVLLYPVSLPSSFLDLVFPSFSLLLPFYFFPFLFIFLPLHVCFPFQLVMLRFALSWGSALHVTQGKWQFLFWPSVLGRRWRGFRGSHFEEGHQWIHKWLGRQQEDESSESTESCEVCWLLRCLECP